MTDVLFTDRSEAANKHLAGVLRAALSSVCSEFKKYTSLQKMKVKLELKGEEGHELKKT
jgi:hypothetical protein